MSQLQDLSKLDFLLPAPVWCWLAGACSCKLVIALEPYVQQHPLNNDQRLVLGYG